MDLLADPLADPLATRRTRKTVGWRRNAPSLGHRGATDAAGVAGAAHAADTAEAAATADATADAAATAQGQEQLGSSPRTIECILCMGAAACNALAWGASADPLESATVHFLPRTVGFSGSHRIRCMISHAINA